MVLSARMGCCRSPFYLGSSLCRTFWVLQITYPGLYWLNPGQSIDICTSHFDISKPTGPSNLQTTDPKNRGRTGTYEPHWDFVLGLLGDRSLPSCVRGSSSGVSERVHSCPVRVREFFRGKIPANWSYIWLSGVVSVRLEGLRSRGGSASRPRSVRPQVETITFYPKCQDEQYPLEESFIDFLLCL